MVFDSFAAFLNMGGHAPYVWSAWGVTAALLLGSVVLARQERRHLLRELKRQERLRAQHVGRNDKR